MKYNRFLPLVIPLLAFGLLEIFFFWPNMIYAVASLGVIIFLFTARQFIKASATTEKWWNLIILPSLFFGGSISFSIFAISGLWVQLLFVANFIFLHLYFRSIYYLLSEKQETHSYSVENLSAYGNFLSFYFISSAIFGLESYLRTNVWSLMLVLLAVVGLTVYQVIWANKIDFKIGFFYILLIAVVLIETAWSITFLSLSFYILGLILSVCYYMLIGLARFHLTKKLNAKIVKIYLAFGFASILIVLFSSRWL